MSFLQSHVDTNGTIRYIHQRRREVHPMVLPKDLERGKIRRCSLKVQLPVLSPHPGAER
jgi:hypothetical protein